MPISLDEIKVRLHEILNEKPGELREHLVWKFDDIMFLRDDLDINDDFEDVLIDLAHELEYYNSDFKLRKENQTFFGDEELVLEINNALQEIEVLGKPN